MISRALLVALCIVYATSLTPLAPLTATTDDDCALYLTGPGRSSAYDYSLNLLKGNFAYDGQHTCITYDAINQAYLDARTRILVSQPKGDWRAEDFASVGELILDISISLARTYGLSYEEIEKGLPLIDTSRTLIREVCPPVFSHVECRAGKYRRLDGLCNNVKHPTWGATMAPFQRLIGPLFSDGINAPRISHSGHELPLSRVVSRTMHPDEGFHDHAGTVMVIAWGQFMDHDYTLTGTPLDPVHRNDPEECCKRPLHLKHPYCNEIRIPDDDYFYRLFGVKCIDFVRGFPSPRPGCRLGSRIPFNTLTGAIDGNTVYGVTEKFARKLRTGFGGLLRMNPVFKEYGLKDLLPLKLDIPDEGCTRPNKNMYCFEAGEIRVNEQLVLTVMHTLMAREHNRVAEALAHVNPHWDDETLFQEARRINIAEIQHITYNEFLPILLGKDVMEKFGLVLAKEGYWDGYDEEVNPDVIASFAAAAYRFGHSLLPTAVERWSKAHKFIASKRLSDLIRRPYDLYRAGVLDEYVMGLMNQVAQAMDDSITQEVTNHLFKKVGARFGMDLVSFNMQRGREFGFPGYMEFRKFCGLSGAESFQDLFGSMPNETIRKYESIFEHPIDVDLWSGGVSERPLPGSMLGPTFACIIATQFSYSRRGDRFWFELPNQPSSFTPEQLVEIRKSRLARIICDNTDIIDTVQLYPMVLPDHELNPRVPCRSGIIPSMDFSKWADPVQFISGAKEYMTDAHTFNGTRTQNYETETICKNDNGSCVSNKNTHTNLVENQNTNFSDSTKNKELGHLCLRDANSTDCLNSKNKTDCNEESCSTVTLNRNQYTINKMQENPMSKYISNNKDATEKLKGHFKNSLKRKRRSFTRNIEDNKKNHVSGIYEVIEDQNKERGELNLPKFDPSEIIKNSAIADFPVESLHKIKRPHYNTLQGGTQRHYHKENNNQYFPKPKIRQDTHASDENSSYQDDEYKTSREKRTQTQDLQDTLHRKHYLPKTKEVTEESAEVNIREKLKHKDSAYQDENDGRHVGHYRKDESFHKDINSLKNNLPRENIKSYMDNSKISNGEQVENVSGEIISKNDSSLEDEEDEDDTKDERFNVNQKQTFPESRKQGYNNESIKNTNTDQFSYEDDENDENDEESIKKLKINEKLRVNDNNLHRQDDKDGTNEKRDEFQDDEDDDDEPLENFKKDENIHIIKPPVNDILEGHNKKYNGQRNEYFSLAPERTDKDDDESYKKYGDNDDDDSKENFSIDREHNEYSKPPNNILQRQTQSNFKNKNYAHGPGNAVKENDDSNERRDIYKEKQGQGNVLHDINIHDYKQPKLIQKQSQFYNNKNNGYPLLQLKKSKEESNESYERESPNKDDGFNENKEIVKNYSRQEGLLTTTEENTPLNVDSKNSQENNSHLKYASQPIHISGTIGRPDIQIKASIENGIQHLLTSDRPIYVNTNFESNFNDNFTDNKQKETTIPKDNSNDRPSSYRKQVQKSLENSKAVPEIDLSDFSYDKFRGLSDVDTFEPVTHKQKASTIKPKIKKNNKKSANLKKSNKNKPIHIHVPKPVQDLSNENIREEIKEHSNENLSDNLQSTILNEGKHRKINSNKRNRKAKVKPLNYGSTKSETSDKGTESEGTLDTLSPKNNKFDENLKIKFGDVNIKLPEIRLPKDILSYAQEDQVNKDKTKSIRYTYAPYEPKKKSQGNPENVYHYDPTDAPQHSEQPKSKGDKPAEEYDFFASYINKPHEENHSDDAHSGDIEDGEDLYERFVRERFGRKDSFKERSEKLQEKKALENKPVTKNKELFDNIQKAIKRAEEVQKEAEKSKDPKANYLWTLEYGEKL